MIIDLDTEAGLDPGQVGAKAAWLALGRRAGLPVLPGLVVGAPASRHHMEVGTAVLAARGSGAARLAVMSEPVAGADRLVESASALGDHLVVRSSTPLEASAEWSGAFASYLDIRPTELPKAVAGCWASAFTVASLERLRAAEIEPGSFPMAVLVQRELDPVAGGTAVIEDDGTVVVHGIKGSPAPLLQGWVGGSRASRGETWYGEELIGLIGEDMLDQIGEQIIEAQTSLGVTRCEWALEEGIWLLQMGTRGQAQIPTPPPVEVADPGLVAIARAAAKAPGRLGEELVLPWAIAGLPAPPSPPAEPSPLSTEEAFELRNHLVADVWGLPADRAMAAAGECIGTLLGPDPASALPALEGARPPDPEPARRLLSHVEASLRPSHATRLGIGRWEPFVASVTLAFGSGRVGIPASPGVGAGVQAHIGHPHAIDVFRSRSVVTAPQPVPNLAPLLWDAAGLVTETGSPAAHLFESA
ncbi:MAG TPA: PEP/pyruvate-binding domain-containing protein, partial [Acidimicrobiia bacterium]|nr:PEP/pyruvate-binding domain-containing protein [Acidimicrobiia bacterium]